MEGHSPDAARAVKDKLKSLLAGHPAVNGIGIVSRDDGFALKVNLSRPLGAAEAIPDRIDGVPIETEYVGPARKLPA